MIALLLAAHQELGPALLAAAEGIVGTMERTLALSLNYDEDPSDARKRIEDALRRLDEGDGVLVLTDMFGGTPTNLILPFLEDGQVEVLTGINLPALVKAQTARGEMGLKELALYLKEYGARNIVVASEIWNARPKAAG